MIQGYAIQCDIEFRRIGDAKPGIRPIWWTGNNRFSVVNMQGRVSPMWSDNSANAKLFRSEIVANGMAQEWMLKNYRIVWISIDDPADVSD